MFYPDKATGKRARMRMQARLAEAAGHVFEQSRGTVPFDEQAAAELLAVLTSDGTARPTKDHSC